MKLWRCDVCQELIDPVEADERSMLLIEFQTEHVEAGRERVDLCEECRPDEFGHFIDWLIHSMEDL